MERKLLGVLGGAFCVAAVILLIMFLSSSSLPGGWAAMDRPVASPSSIPQPLSSQEGAADGTESHDLVFMSLGYLGVFFAGGAILTVVQEKNKSQPDNDLPRLEKSEGMA